MGTIITSEEGFSTKDTRQTHKAPAPKPVKEPVYTKPNKEVLTERRGEREMTDKQTIEQAAPLDTRDLGQPGTQQRNTSPKRRGKTTIGKRTLAGQNQVQRRLNAKG